jgi:hypothetical protein
MKIGWCARLDEAAPIPEDGKRNALAFLRRATAPLTCLAGDRT